MDQPTRHIYALANLVWFGSPFPVSALAKSVHTSFGVNLIYAQRVALARRLGKPSLSCCHLV